MFCYLILSVVNGVIIGISRAINSRLGIHVGAFKASFWNHIVGFLFLVLILILIKGFKFNTVAHIPVVAYLGGCFGALFVAVNSYVFHRIGAVKTILLVISGQMIASVLFDYKPGSLKMTLVQFLGVMIILIGVYLAKSSGASSKKSKVENIDNG